MSATLLGNVTCELHCESLCGDWLDVWVHCVCLL